MSYMISVTLININFKLLLVKFLHILFHVNKR